MGYRYLAVAIVSLLGALVGLTASADQIKPSQPEVVIRDYLAKKFPNSPVKSIRQLPGIGLWEVFNGVEVVYVSEGAKWFIVGNMIETDTGKNLTQPRLDKLLITDFSALPASQAMTIKRGNGTRRVALFADPQCSFCKKLEVELAKLDDITIDVYITPVLGPTSVDRAKDIACAENKTQAWDAWMLRNEMPSKASDKCVVTFDKNLALGKSLGIRAVPVLVFTDGSRMAGAQPATEIEKRLASSSATQKVAAN